MINFLARRFIKNYRDVQSPKVRTAYGVLCGAVGIGINLLLFTLKLIAGAAAGSVAVTADAFNNLSMRARPSSRCWAFALPDRSRIRSIPSDTEGSNTFPG